VTEELKTLLASLDIRWNGGTPPICPICGEAPCITNHRRRDDLLFPRQVEHDRSDHRRCWSNAYCRTRNQKENRNVR
jgi:hypothetical protein